MWCVCCDGAVGGWCNGKDGKDTTVPWSKDVKEGTKIPKEVVVGFFCSWFDSRVRSTNDNGHKECKVSNVSEKIHVNLLWSEC